ncbi:protein of unknown function [Pseudodesulfovibrio profundus]|uniref:Uncharacterized protein n=1 Tax=Pseudodesulfovibrio profundus TaxID=57320 RepID=A0A2C8FE06_9BACT|nr:protein of unknown function [Pseudodesulfovibrio profundus]
MVQFPEPTSNLFIILWWSWWGIYPTTFLNAIQGVGFYNLKLLVIYQK